jgi:AbiV family abortive infection protein
MSDDKKNDRMVISNAKRLVRDAVFLKDHERHASAYALAILGLEEIGKVILKRWGEPEKERRWHVNKQMAVAALVLMDDVMRRVQQEIQLTPNVFERVARAAMESEVGHFSATVSSKLLDGWKQFALYSDGEFSDAGLHADQIIGADVELIFKASSFALNAIDDDETMRLAKDHFRAKKEQAKRAFGPP